MDISPIGRIDSGSTAVNGLADSAQSENARNAFTAARKLNNLDIADRQFTVVRDPASQRFKIEVIDEQTGTVLDQFPPEDILKMLAQISSSNPAKSGDESK